MRPQRPTRRDRRVHGDVRENAFEAVWTLVRRIPKGRVMTYGQISELLEQRLSPVAVGWALSGCPKNVPWQRVVNASGGCSTDRRGEFPQGLQQALLEAEGVRFDSNGTLDLDRFRYKPRLPKPAIRKPRARSDASRP